VRICSFSLDQALGIWSDLWQAYYGDNGYGGRTAEIYAYRLVGHQPVWCQEPCPDAPTPYLKEASWEAGVEAKRNLITLLLAFQEAANCFVDVDGVSLAEWDDGQPLFHRCHVTIQVESGVRQRRD